MRLAVLGLSLALCLLASASGAGSGLWQAWTLTQGSIEPLNAAASLPATVGSLQKPWVLKAWAAQHGDRPAPEAFCPGSHECWRIGGHGWLGLRRAVAESCNAYFRRLAEATHPETLATTFQEAGFLLSGRPTADSLIGLEAPAATVQISPAGLLRAFYELIREPWGAGETHRLELLRGLEEAGRSGTAGGAGLRGLLVKTGTVSRGGNSLESLTGWVLAASPSGERVALGRLEEATGRLAARELGTRGLFDSAEISAEGPPGLVVPEVSVWIFSSLRLESLAATNLTAAPVLVESPGGARWIGQGGTTEVAPGQRLGNAAWELEARPYGLRRRFTGSLEMERGSGMAPGRVILTTPARNYVEGVLRAELRQGSRARAQELSTVVLRFLKRGRRHGLANVCDRNHCAWFVGDGPDVVWLDPDRPVPVDGNRAEGPRIDDSAWSEIGKDSESAGPDLWSDHCGGKPLSEWEVWGRGSRRIWPCSRHLSPTRAWRRNLPASGLATLFGSPVADIKCVSRNGFRKTLIQLASGKSLELSFDELHRRLAGRFGWSSLPAPPEKAERRKTEWVFSGYGSGHRVGLCLAD